MAKKKTTEKKVAAKKVSSKKRDVKKAPVKKTVAKKTSVKKKTTSKASKPPKKASLVLDSPFSHNDIAACAYYIYLERMNNQKPGDSYNDWVEAKRRLEKVVAE